MTLDCPGVSANRGRVIIVVMLPCPAGYPPPPLDDDDVVSDTDFDQDKAILIYNW